MTLSFTERPPPECHPKFADEGHLVSSSPMFDTWLIFQEINALKRARPFGSLIVPAPATWLRRRRRAIAPARLNKLSYGEATSAWRGINDHVLQIKVKNVYMYNNSKSVVLRESK